MASTAFGPLCASLRNAEAHHHDLKRLLSRIVEQRQLGDADDVAVVLRHLLNTVATSVPRGSRLRPRLVAGLIPEPLGPMTDEHRQAIDERKTLIETRAQTLLQTAIEGWAPWLRDLGLPPSDLKRRDAWTSAAITVAAHRDRYQITSDRPFGTAEPANTVQRVDRHRALDAARAATAIATPRQTHSSAVVPDVRPVRSR